MHKVKNKKIILLFLAIGVMAGMVIAGTGISRAYSLDQAKNSARQVILSSAIFLSYHKDGSKFTFRYFDKNLQERIEIEVDRQGRRIRKIQTQKVDRASSTAPAQSNEQLIKTVKNEYPNASIKEIIPGGYQGNNYTTITFTAPDMRGAYQFDPSSGMVLFRTIKFGKPVAIPLTGEGDNGSLLSLPDLKRIGEQKVPDAVFQDLDIFYADGIYSAEIDLSLNGIRHELVVDGRSGKELSYEFYKEDWQTFARWEPMELEIPLLHIINFDNSLAFSKYIISPAPSATPSASPASASETSKADPTSSPTPTTAVKNEPTAVPTPTKPQLPQTIGIERVKSLVLKRLPGAQIDTIDLDKEDGRLIYRGKAASGATEVDYEIDAYTGIFVKWDVDTDND